MYIHSSKKGDGMLVAKTFIITRNGVRQENNNNVFLFFNIHKTTSTQTRGLPLIFVVVTVLKG
jgi:hypothetical protein